jgi:hypothetical protein
MMRRALGQSRRPRKKKAVSGQETAEDGVSADKGEKA